MHRMTLMSIIILIEKTNHTWVMSLLRSYNRSHVHVVLPNMACILIFEVWYKNQKLSIKRVIRDQYDDSK